MIVATAALGLVALALVAALVALQRQHARQVEGLLQRIQAPDTAVAQHLVGDIPAEPQHLPFGDDEAFERYEADMRDPFADA